jgi:hypothetical protein
MAMMEASALNTPPKVVPSRILCDDRTVQPRTEPWVLLAIDALNNAFVKGHNAMLSQVGVDPSQRHERAKRVLRMSLVFW